MIPNPSKTFQKHFVEVEWNWRWSSHGQSTLSIPFYPLLSTRPDLALPGGHLGPQLHQQKPSPAKVKKWKRMKKNHLIWTIYNGFYEFLWTAHHAMNKNIIHEYGWIWVVDRVVHYMLLWSIMEILLPISTKWLLTSRGAYKMDPVGTQRNI